MMQRLSDRMLYMVLTGNALLAVDVNYDGRVNAVDATCVARHTTGEVVSFWY